ncbi:MAG: aminodeoxychorismate/anthranilate synthase component II [Bacteroidetes bacterium]|nr:aminodeoxychorismate/anthranilate synthase component II [Bacteroidota bacterium]
MKLLVLDNYDSFTYNLVQYIQEILETKVDVFRNDAISLDEVENFDVIVLSPGPGVPSEAGIMPELINKYAPHKTIFGVCLGHQAIGEAFGGTLINLEKVYHGVETPIQVTDKEEILFKDIPEVFNAGRYHSWSVSNDNFPDCFKVTAVDEIGEIMAMRHTEYDVCGLQFHPESVMTEFGWHILKNYLDACLEKYVGCMKFHS